MLNIKSEAKAFFLWIKSRQFAIAVFAVAVALLTFWITSRIKTVIVDDGEKTLTLYTAVLDPREIMDSLGIDPGHKDKVTISGFDEPGPIPAEIKIQSAAEVCISADGLTYHVSVGEGDTVGDALYASGIEMRATDLLSQPVEKPVEDKEKITLTRVDYILTTEEEEIEHGKVYQGTSLLKEGKKSTIIWGKNGTLLKTFEQKVVDGEYTERVLISEDVIKKPTDTVTLVGDGSVISPLDYGWSFENGVPVGYKKLYSDVRATGYYAPWGAGTATGRLAQVGYVAVDPKIVPYGSKLWIVAHDSSSPFVYGYALAADTGGAMLSGKNFVDLYYSTYSECVLNAVRKVDVYVLE